MPEQLYQKIIDEVSRAPQFVQMIYELHNEPLLDKRLFGWIGDFRSRGRAKEAMIVTNGELLDQFEMKDIKTSKLDAITISLNAASKETFEKINCGLNYERVMRNVEKLLKDKSPDLKVMMSFAVGDLNKTEVYEAARYWKSRGINSRIVEMTNRAGMLDNFLSLRPKQPLKEPGFPAGFRSALLSSLKNKMGCSLPFYQMNILFNGDAVICCNDWNRMTVVGNVTRNSISEIWNSDQLNMLRRHILDKDYKAIESCKGCSAAV
jgi:radical SAM protein with 4Fe4S-binding SPASM domain